MTVSFQLPASVEEKLRAQTPDISSDAKEAYAVELFRLGRLSHYELSQVLGLDRFQTNACLKRHNVIEGSLTMQDLEDQTQTLDRVLGPVRD